MATYATYAELVQRYGAAALAAMIPSDATDSVATLAGQALVEAAAEIDATLAGRGYTVPVDTSAITDADQQARAAALLRRIEVGLAVSALSREFAVASNLKSEKVEGVTQTWNDKARADSRWARSMLEALGARALSIPGISPPGRAFIRHSSAAVPSATDVSDRISQAGGW